MAENTADAPQPASKERELGTMPIGKLFVKYSLISLSGMIAQIVMVVLEGIIMGMGLGAHGLACVSIIISVELLNLATGGALGIGVSAVVGARLGSNDHEGAQRAFGQGFWFSLYVALALTIVLEVFAPWLVRLIGATDDIYADTLVGVRGFVALFPFTIMGQVATSVLRVDERPQAAARLQILASGVAISYLAIAILALHWGVPSAGIYFGLTIGLWSLGYRYFLPKGKSTLKIRTQDMRPEGVLVRDVVKFGFPFFVLELASSLYTAVVNNRLGALGSSMDIAAFAIINGYVIYVLQMFVEAFGFAMQAISSFNAGAKRYDRLSELIKKGLAIQTVFMAVVSLIICLFPEAFCSLFARGDAELIAASASPTRMVVALCVLGFMAQLMSSYFECVGKVVEATVCGCALYVIFTIPLIYALGPIMGVQGVWIAQLAANVFAGILALVLAFRELRRLKKL